MHITFDARKLITNELVRAINSIAAGREGKHVNLRGWLWPMRQNFVRRAQITGIPLPDRVHGVIR